MPGPTTERLDDDFRSLRDDMQDIKIVLAEINTKLGELDNVRAEVRSNTAGLATLDGRFGTLEARLNWLIGVGKWLGGIFALAAVYGVFNFWGRLGIVEIQLRNLDGRLVEMRESIGRHQTDSPAQLEERINRIARTAVDEAIRRASLPKSNP